MYKVSTEKFAGPLDLLLQLVEKKNLEITEISLAQVTQDYMSYVGNQELVPSEELADFLVIASTLLLIKSKSLLPTLKLESAEQEEILDLENRLQLYKIYRERGLKIYEMWSRGHYAFTRTPWAEEKVGFSPPPHLTADALLESWRRVLVSWEEEVPLTEKKMAKIVTLRQRIKELVQKLTHGRDYNLAELVPDPDKRMELTLTFLAVLYLVKEDVIKIKQEKNFGTIWISS